MAPSASGVMLAERRTGGCGLPHRALSVKRCSRRLRITSTVMRSPKRQRVEMSHFDLELNNDLPDELDRRCGCTRWTDGWMGLRNVVTRAKIRQAVLVAPGRFNIVTRRGNAAHRQLLFGSCSSSRNDVRCMAWIGLAYCWARAGRPPTSSEAELQRDRIEGLAATEVTDATIHQGLWTTGTLWPPVGLCTYKS